MKTEHRSALLALAARRGEKGFSNVLADAIEEYLDGERDRGQRRKELFLLAGSLSDEEAEALRAEVKAVREHWR